MNNGIGNSTQIFYYNERRISRRIDLISINFVNSSFVLRTVRRNPCPCSYNQATSDFRFYKMNSENRFEKNYNISCFVPSNAFAQIALDTTSYQQVISFKKTKIICFNLTILFRHVVMISTKDPLLHLVNLLDLFWMKLH